MQLHPVLSWEVLTLGTINDFNPFSSLRTQTSGMQSTLPLQYSHKLMPPRKTLFPLHQPAILSLSSWASSPPRTLHHSQSNKEVTSLLTSLTTLFQTINRLILDNNTDSGAQRTMAFSPRILEQKLDQTRVADIVKFYTLKRTFLYWLRCLLTSNAHSTEYQSNLFVHKCFVVQALLDILVLFVWRDFIRTDSSRNRSSAASFLDRGGMGTRLRFFVSRFRNADSTFRTILVLPLRNGAIVKGTNETGSVNSAQKRNCSYLMSKNCYSFPRWLSLRWLSLRCFDLPPRTRRWLSENIKWHLFFTILLPTPPKNEFFL